jgi:hypothetical protein
MKQFPALLILLIFISCSSSKQTANSTNNTDQKTELLDDQTFLLMEISTDLTYGTKTNPVQVGGAKNSSGPKNERRFLNALAGPNGERISYYRAGSCCEVKSENGFMGWAMLDNYRVTWEGSKDTISIYINMYDAGVLKAPAGFTIRK